MALILREKSICPICGKVLKTGEEVMGFPPFVANQADPLLLFHDAGFHRSCVLAHPLWPKLNQRMLEYAEKTGPGHRKCFVCGTEIVRAEEYFGLGHLTDDLQHPLHRFNYAHFHRSHLAGWAELPTLIAELEKLDQSGTWEGDGLKRLVTELRGMS